MHAFRRDRLRARDRAEQAHDAGARARQRVPVRRRPSQRVGKVPDGLRRRAARSRAAMRAWSRSARPGSTFTATTRRARIRSAGSAPSSRIADELGLPVVIHQRSALEETLAILEEMRAPGRAACCTASTTGPTPSSARTRIGFKLGLGGVPDLRARRRSTRRCARRPADMLVLETDAPYLEPEPRSLRRNEPALLRRVRERLCELRGWMPEEADARHHAPTRREPVPSADRRRAHPRTRRLRRARRARTSSRAIRCRKSGDMPAPAPLHPRRR